MTNAIVPAPPAVPVVSGETKQSASIAHATATIQARYFMAVQRPRSWDDVRIKILAECKRPGFARVARYRKPIGRGVEGPSIRFAEACIRYAGNIDCPVTTTYDDRFKRTLHVEVIDLETNASFSTDIHIEKTVERHEPKDRIIVGERKNASNQTVYILEATEDELLNKINAYVSKATRTLALRLIPGDIIEEGQKVCVDTMHNEAAQDPAGQRKAVCDAFAAVGVLPLELQKYLGHPLDVMQPVELVELREIYATIKDGETTWAAVLEAKHGGAQKTEPEGTQMAAIADKVKARQAAKQPAKTREPGEEG